MIKEPKSTKTENLAQIAIKGIQEKKGKEIVQLDLRRLDNAISDFFIVCHGTSNRQVESIAESVIDEVRAATGEKPFHTEGKSTAEWILIDFVDVVVHVFQKEVRDHYALEELWADAPAKHIEE